MRSAMPRSIVGEDTACLQCDRSLPAVGSDAARFSTQPRECGAGGGSQHFSAYRPYLRPVPLCRLGASEFVKVDESSGCYAAIESCS